MDKPDEPILLEKQLESPLGFLLVVIVVLCGTAYLQVSGNWNGMGLLHWGATILICGAVFIQPMANAGRTVRFKTDERGIHFDPFRDTDPVSIDWNNIEKITLHQGDGWIISIQLKSEAGRAWFQMNDNIQISDDYGLPLDVMFKLLVASHEKYKS